MNKKQGIMIVNNNASGKTILNNKGLAVHQYEPALFKLKNTFKMNVT